MGLHSFIGFIRRCAAIKKQSEEATTGQGNRDIGSDCYIFKKNIDLVYDTLNNGTKFISFNVINNYKRKVLFIETDYSLKSRRVIY
jgi:hypothetical protein